MVTCHRSAWPRSSPTGSSDLNHKGPNAACVRALALLWRAGTVGGVRLRERFLLKFQLDEHIPCSLPLHTTWLRTDFLLTLYCKELSQVTHHTNRQRTQRSLAVFFVPGPPVRFQWACPFRTATGRALPSVSGSVGGSGSRPGPQFRRRRSTSRCRRRPGSERFAIGPVRAW